MNRSEPFLLLVVILQSTLQVIIQWKQWHAPVAPRHDYFGDAVERALYAFRCNRNKHVSLHGSFFLCNHQLSMNSA
ncbi:MULTISPECIES: hypothetical protein [Mesorhizobium]|uniref:hypothetical protein n=1 Tax=Mesorhizobium TaxID=68287 RepID=UPI001F0A9932|nr:MULTISPECIES: hypothetical protein [Mesorhizobium]MCH4560078.1 hypothetical protein [Mesorhizobium jarvisii]